MKLYQKGSFLFTLLIFSYMLLLYCLAFTYGLKTREVPLVVLTPGLILTILILVGEVFPKLLRSMDIDLVKGKQESLEAESLEAKPYLSRAGMLMGQRGLLVITGWLVGFSVLIFLVGFLIAIPIGVFVFLKVFGHQNWLRSLAITVATWAFIYLFFDVLMSFDMFKGILFGEIVII